MRSTPKHFLRNVRQTHREGVGGCGGLPMGYVSARNTVHNSLDFGVHLCFTMCILFSHTIKNIVCKHVHIPTVRIPCTKSLLSTHHFMGAQLNTLMTGDDSSTANTPVFCFQHVKPGVNFFHLGALLNWAFWEPFLWRQGANFELPEDAVFGRHMHKYTNTIHIFGPHAPWQSITCRSESCPERALQCNALLQEK